MKTSNVHFEYIEILKKIKSEKDYLDENPTELNSIVNTSNILLNDVNNTADLKIDAKISAIYSDVYLKLFKKNVNGKPVSLDEFVKFVNSKRADNWYHKLKTLSKGFSVVSFIDFDLMAEEKRKRTFERLKIEIKQAETPDENTVKNNDNSSGFINELLNELRKGRLLPYYSTVIDTSSFARTIEKVFDLSIAIRSKQIMLVVRDDSVFIGPYKESDTVYNEHIIEDFDYNRYLELVKKIKSGH